MDKNKFKLIRVCVGIFCFFITFICSFFLKEVESYVWAIIYGVIYLFTAYDVLYKAVRNIFRGKVFDENFLMVLATIGAFIIGEYAEGVAVILFYQVGELFEKYAVGKSRKSISELMDIRPERATRLENGNEVVISPEEIAVDDILIVKVGEKIPVDGVILSGESSLNTSALTGESMPRSVKTGDEVLSGCINEQGVLKIKAQKEYFDSTVSKILDLVENVSGKKAKAENFITRFARYYTPIVVISALLLALIPSLITGEWSVWVLRALTFLVVSCPCALVISVPLSFFGGIGGAGKCGVLVKGGSYLELIEKANIFLFDKTGTITKGEFKIQKIYPQNKSYEILSIASICEKNSNHPIAKSIIKGYSGKIEHDYEIKEIAGKGVKATKNDDVILCGNEQLLKDHGVTFEKANEFGSIVYVAKNDEFKGYIVISDSVKDEAKEVISKLKALKCKTIMLTGDNYNFAKVVANEVGVDDFKSDLLPADKVKQIEEIINNKKETDVVAFVGDGINDAPSLMRADLGISMGGVGSASAIEASDIVLMYDKLGGILQAKKIAKKTVSIVKQNIIFALTVKIGVLILSAFGLANMWFAVFADVGVAVIAILNAMRAIKVKK